MGISSYMPLELLYINNLLKRSAWNRYFFNEKYYIKDYDEIKELDYKPYDLRDPSQKESFIKNLKVWNQKFPGLLAPEGEEVDIQKFVDDWFRTHPEGKTVDPVKEF